MASRTRSGKILEMAKRNAEIELLLNLPFYETTKGLDPDSRDLAVKGWNYLYFKKSTEITLEANAGCSSGNFNANFIDKSLSPQGKSISTKSDIDDECQIKPTRQNKKLDSKNKRKRISVFSTSSDNTSFNDTLNAEVSLTRPTGNKQENQETYVFIDKTVPGKAKCTECKEKYKTLDTRSWKDVKFYVKNFISKMEAAKKKACL